MKQTIFLVRKLPTSVDSYPFLLCFVQIQAMWNNNFYWFQKFNVVWSAFNHGGYQRLIGCVRNTTYQRCFIVDHTKEDTLFDAVRNCTRFDDDTNVRVQRSVQLPTSTAKCALYSCGVFWTWRRQLGCGVSSATGSACIGTGLLNVGKYSEGSHIGRSKNVLIAVNNSYNVQWIVCFSVFKNCGAFC